jgi:hypothetical protein
MGTLEQVDVAVTCIQPKLDETHFRGFL